VSASGDGAKSGRADAAGLDLPAPVADALELLTGESATSRTFLGGLFLGALVGAALAGSAFVRQRATREGKRAGKG
jgi:hypothetical protein